MTIRREVTIQRFTVLSTDTKPTGVPPGSYCWEYDTNDVFKTYDGTNWVIHQARSITQLSVETLDFQQIVADYPLYTATAGVVRIINFTLTNTIDHSGDAGAFTGMSVIATNTPATTLISQAAGVKANLTAAAVFTYDTPFILLNGQIINYHVYGAASTLAGPFVASIVYQVLTPAGYLA